MGRLGEIRPSAFSGAAAVAVLLVSILLAMSLWAWVAQRGSPKDDSWSAKPIANTWIIDEVEASGPAAGKLKPGDRILSVNSQVVTGFRAQLPVTRFSDTYEMEVTRGGQNLRLVLPVWRQAHGRLIYVFFFLLATVYLVLAGWIALARPGDRTAQTAFFLLLAGADAFASEALRGFAPQVSSAWQGFVLLLGARAWRPLEWALFFDFSLRFPTDAATTLTQRRLRSAFYGFGAVISLASLLQGLVNFPPGSISPGSFPAWFTVEGLDYCRKVSIASFSAVVLVSALVILTAKYRSVADPSVRTRLRWVALGIAVALVPIAIDLLLDSALRVMGQADLFEQISDFLGPLAAGLSALIPITFAYAIVKHRVMGIRFAIRLGVQYLLARNVLRTVWYLPLIGFCIDIAANPRQSLQDLLIRKSWWFYALLFVSFSLSLRYRKSIELWVDNRFFRSAYEEELILSELVERMQACDTSDEVARLVTTTLENAFHCSGAALLSKRNEDSKFTVAYAHEAPFALQLCGEANSNSESLKFIRLPLQSASASSQSTGSQPPITYSPDALVTSIKKPNGEVTALLLLGPKKSEEKYSGRDYKLLQAVATQTGLILEVIVLKERVREEGRVRVEVLAKLDRDSIQLLLECPACGRCYSGQAAATCKADRRKLVYTLPVERTIDGKYQLERRIGAGGMGAVYEATDLRLGRTVAVKVLIGRLFANSVALRRFEREARASARLQHPNIISVYDFGSLRGDGAFLVMQRVAGHSWRAELERAGSIKNDRAALWFDQLCDAMDAAHSSGVIHRDLKPENVLISRFESGAEKITVLDFGLAKVNALDFGGDCLTEANDIVGTLAYMSPEQRTGERVDARSDIYSIAAMVAETVSGRRPTKDGASTQWLNDSLVWSTRTETSEQLLLLLRRNLADDPAKRLASVKHFQRELIPLLKRCDSISVGRAVSASGDDGTTLPI